MYLWRDKNGIRHYSEKPPPEKEVGLKDLNIVETAPLKFYHKNYCEVEGDQFCDKELLSKGGEDPRKTLINAYRIAVRARNTKKNYEKSYSELLSREYQTAAKTGKTIRFEFGRKSIEERLAHCECLMIWSEHKINELKHYVDIILNDVDLEKQQLNEILPDCGDEPSPGWHNDKEALDWADCVSKRNHSGSIKKHKKALKKASSIKKALIDAIGKYNKRR